jgi:hypothetical protein
MRKKIFVLVAMAALALAATGCGKKQNANDQNTNNQNVNNEQSGTGEETFLGSLKDLMDGGKSLKCTWKSNEEDKNEIDGTLYIQGKKFRQDVSFNNTGGEEGGLKMEFHAISDGEWAYTWNSNVPDKGSKMKLSELEKGKAETTNGALVDTAKQNNYTCLPWTVDDSEFVPPAGMVFEDITAEAQDFQENASANAEAAKKMICDACEKAPEGAAKDQCRANAKCE